MNGWRGVRIGRITGIEITVDYSWFFIVALMTWSLASSLARWHPDWSAFPTLVFALVASLLFFLSVLLHELAHSLVARRIGVPVRSITLFLFGGVSNIERDPPSAKAEFATALVGPLTSIAIGAALLAAAWTAMRAAGAPAEPGAIRVSGLNAAQTLLLWLGAINLLVAVFNLIPAFPLDGGRVLRSALWAFTGDLRSATRWASASGQAIGWCFVLLGIAMVFGARIPLFGGGVIGGLWLAFIGWFLSSAAAQTWRRQLAHEVLEGLPVSRLARPAGRVVSPRATLDQLVNDWLRNADDHAFAVVEGEGRLTGVVSLADLQRVARVEWARTTVADVMTPAGRVVTTRSEEDLAVAFEKLVRSQVEQLPVVEDGGRLVGMLTRRDVMRWIDLHLSRRARGYAH